MSKIAFTEKQYRMLKILRPVLIIVICVHSLLVVWSLIYTLREAHMKVVNERVLQIAHVIAYLSEADKRKVFKAELEIINQSHVHKHFDIALSKGKPEKTILIAPEGKIGETLLKKTKKHFAKHKRLTASIYLKNHKKWLSVSLKEEVHVNYLDIISTMFFTVLLPMLMIIVLTYFYFFIYRKSFLVLIKDIVDGKYRKVDFHDSYLEKEINQLKQTVQQMVSEKTLMLTALAHDINAPIMRMRLVIDDMGSDTHQDALEQELNYMTHVISSTYSIVRSEGMVENSKAFDLTSLLEALAEERYRNEDKVSFDLSDDSLVVKGDPILIDRAVINLVNNSLKHADQVKVSLVKYNYLVKLIIEDNGPGIPAEKLESLQQPFQQLDFAKSGVGLGLAIVRRIVDLHAADLSFENIKPHGLKVIIAMSLVNP